MFVVSFEKEKDKRREMGMTVLLLLLLLWKKVSMCREKVRTHESHRYFIISRRGGCADVPGLTRVVDKSEGWVQLGFRIEKKKKKQKNPHKKV